MKTKSIKSYLVKGFSISSAVIFILLFIITANFVYSKFLTIKSNGIENTLNSADENLTAQIETMYASARAIASDKDVYTTSTTFEQKKDKLVAYQKALGISSIGYITKEGYLTSTDGFENDISSRQYFKDFMNGKDYISNPSYNTATGKMIIFVGVPLYENGAAVGGLTCTFDAIKLSSLIESINYAGKGEAYLLGNDGTLVAGKDQDKVSAKYNVVSESAVDSSLKAEADLTTKMINATDAGQSKFNHYAYFWSKPEAGVGWTLVFKLPLSVYTQEMNVMGLMFVIVGICAIAAFIIVSAIIGGNIGNRLMKLKGYLVKLSKGDFTLEPDPKEVKSEDEIGIIYRALGDMITEIRNTVASVKESSARLTDSANTLIETAESLKQNTDTVNQSLNEIQQGNNQQSEEINNINTQMEHFNENVETSQKNIDNVVEIGKDAGDKLAAGEDSMKKLMDGFKQFADNFVEFRKSIENMNENMSSINMITSSISEIASQTNLLSLNASIEAARAGEVGKGFAVVAQEIGKLASESEESAKQISNVINNIQDSAKELLDSTATMDEQMASNQDVFGETMDSIKKLSEGIEAMLPMVRDVSEMSTQNFEAAKTIGDSIQSANAISEELAATTTEVANTTGNFTNSSDKVTEVSEEVENLTKTLTSQVAYFKV